MYTLEISMLHTMLPFKKICLLSYTTNITVGYINSFNHFKWNLIFKFPFSACFWYSNAHFQYWPLNNWALLNHSGVNVANDNAVLINLNKYKQNCYHVVKRAVCLSIINDKSAKSNWFGFFYFEYNLHTDIRNVFEFLIN